MKKGEITMKKFETPEIEVVVVSDIVSIIPDIPVGGSVEEL